MPDFIRTHLIKKIKEKIIEKEKVLKHDGFFFLDNPIDDGKKVINRLNKYSVYPKEELLPLNWYTLKGLTVLEIYSQVKDNDVYIYKIHEGKSHKMRIKKR